MNAWLIALISVIAAAIIAFVINRGIKAHQSQVTTGREELAGKTAKVRTALDPEGTVLFKGEWWQAVSESGRIEVGEEVIITKVDGLKMYVTRK